MFFFLTWFNPLLKQTRPKTAEKLLYPTNKGFTHKNVCVDL